jgi:hypothetical protein
MVSRAVLWWSTRLGSSGVAAVYIFLVYLFSLNFLREFGGFILCSEIAGTRHSCIPTCAAKANMRLTQNCSASFSHVTRIL